MKQKKQKYLRIAKSVEVIRLVVFIIAISLLSPISFAEPYTIEGNSVYQDFSDGSRITVEPHTLYEPGYVTVTVDTPNRLDTPTLCSNFKDNQAKMSKISEKEITKEDKSIIGVIEEFIGWDNTITEKIETDISQRITKTENKYCIAANSIEADTSYSYQMWIDFVGSGKYDIIIGENTLDPWYNSTNPTTRQITVFTPSNNTEYQTAQNLSFKVESNNPFTTYIGFNLTDVNFTDRLIGRWMFDGAGYQSPNQTNIMDKSPSQLNNGTYVGETFNNGAYTGGVFNNGNMSSSSMWGNGNSLYNGTLVNGAWTNGKYGNSILLNETSYATINSTLINTLETSDFTVGLWVKTNGTRGRIFYKYNTDSTRGFMITLEVPTGKADFMIWNTSATIVGEIVSTSAINDNVWHYLTAVRNSTNMTLYVDGSLTSGKGLAAVNISGSTQVYMGRDYIDNFHINGSLDSVRVWNSALSLNQIQTEMNSSIPVNSRGLIWSSEFDEGYGTNFRDSSLYFSKKSPYYVNFNTTNLVNITNTSSALNAGNKSFTIMGWFYQNQQTAVNPRMISQSVNDSTGSTWGFQLIGMGLNTGKQPVFAVFDNMSGVYHLGKTAASSNTLNWNTWYHYTGVWNGTNATLYVNGVASSYETDSPYGILSLSNNAMILDAYQFDGSEDSIRYWNRTLNSSEILAEMNSPYPVSSNGLIGDWEFEEGTGSYINDTNNYVQGKFGTAQRFDGVATYLNSTNDSSLNINNSITVGVWVKPTASVYGLVIGKYNATNTSWRIYRYTDDRYYVATGSVLDAVKSSVHSDLNTWNYLTWVWNGTNNLFYYNGVLDTINLTANATAPALYPTINLRMGGLTNNFAGSIDGVRIWNRSLSSTEINTEMNSNIAVNGYGLIGNWEFEERNGTTAKDTHNFVAGKIGTALKFDGNDDYVNVTNSTSLGCCNSDSNITVMAWVKPISFTNPYGAILEKSSGVVGYNMLVGAGGKLEGRIYPYSASANDTGILTLGTWNHVAMTNTNSTNYAFKLYVNGILVNSSVSANLNSSPANLIIGKRMEYGAPSLPFNGSIDDVIISNRTWSAYEISEYYNKTNNLMTANSSVVYTNPENLALNQTHQIYLEFLDNYSAPPYQMAYSYITYTTGTLAPNISGVVTNGTRQLINDVVVFNATIADDVSVAYATFNFSTPYGTISVNASNSGSNYYVICNSTNTCKTNQTGIYNLTSIRAVDNATNSNTQTYTTVAFNISSAYSRNQTQAVINSSHPNDNIIGIGYTINLSAEFNLTDLNYLWLSTNETGTWTNYSNSVYNYIPLSYTNLSWTNFTFSWSNSSITTDKNVSWMICANTTYGSTNCTGISSFYIDATPPVINIPTVNASMIKLNWSDSFNATITDVVAGMTGNRGDVRFSFGTLNDQATGNYSSNYYLLCNSSGSNCTTNTTGYINLSAASYNYSIRAVDYVGNYQYLNSTVGFYVDGDAPTTTDNSSTSWTNYNQTLRFTCTDGIGIGCSNITYCVNSTTADCSPTTRAGISSGTYNLVIGCNSGQVCQNYTKYYSNDTFGNIEATKYSNLIRIDNQSPATAIAGVKDDGSSYTFGSYAKTNYVNVTLTCSDNGSGCNYTLYCTDLVNTCTPSTAYSSTFQISTQGTSYLRYYSVDNISNVETLTSKTLMLDASGLNISTPTVNGTYPNINDSIMFNTTVTSLYSGVSVVKLGISTPYGTINVTASNYSSNYFVVCNSTNTCKTNMTGLYQVTSVWGNNTAMDNVTLTGMTTNFSISYMYYANNVSSSPNITFGSSINLSQQINASSNLTSIILQTNQSGSMQNESNYPYDININYCYQESANTTNQTGIDGNCNLNYGGSYYSSCFHSVFGANYAYDGNWSSYGAPGTCSLPAFTELYINYTFPNNEINLSMSKWQVKDSKDGQRNISFDSSCINYFNSIKKVVLKIKTNHGDGYYYCINDSSGSSVNLTGNAGDFNIYEDSIFWFMNKNFTFPWSNTSINTNQTIAWRYYTQDQYGNMNVSPTSTFYIYGNAPTITFGGPNDTIGGSTYGSAVWDSHNKTLSLTASVPQLYGVQIYPNKNISYLSINKSPSCTATYAFIYDRNGNQLTNTTFVGNQANFTFQLNASTPYEILAAVEGTTSYTMTYLTAGVAFPYAGVNLNYTNGTYRNNTGSIRHDTNYLYNIFNISSREAITNISFVPVNITPYLNITVNTTNTPAVMNVTFYNATNNAVICANTSITSGTSVGCNWTTALTGVFNYSWYAVATDAYLSYTSPIFYFNTTDITYPNITLNSPTNLTDYYAVAPQLLNITISDPENPILNATFYNASSGSVICSNLSVVANTSVACNWTAVQNNNVGQYVNYSWGVNVTDPYGLKSNYNYSFRYAPAGLSVNVYVSAFGNYTNASITNVTIYNSTNSISFLGNNATYNCSGLPGGLLVIQATYLGQTKNMVFTNDCSSYQNISFLFSGGIPFYFYVYDNNNLPIEGAEMDFYELVAGSYVKTNTGFSQPDGFIMDIFLGTGLPVQIVTSKATYNTRNDTITFYNSTILPVRIELSKNLFPPPENPNACIAPFSGSCYAEIIGALDNRINCNITGNYTNLKLRVTKEALVVPITVCDSSAFDKNITCQLGSTAGNTYHIDFSYKCFNNYILLWNGEYNGTGVTHSPGDNPYANTDGIFFAILIIISITSLGLYMPEAAIILSVASFIICVYFGFVIMGTAAICSMIFAAVLYLWKLRRNAFGGGF